MQWRGIYISNSGLYLLLYALARSLSYLGMVTHGSDGGARAIYYYYYLYYYNYYYPYYFTT